MNAKETVKYLFEHGHIMGGEHYDTIMSELIPITEHPDIQRLIKETVKLQSENEKLKKALSEKGEYGYSQQVVDALTKDRDKLQEQVVAYQEKEAYNAKANN
jgi:regulator of replication initiation timing